MKDNFNCYPLEWDTNYFGVKSARVDLYDEVGSNVQNNIIEFTNDFEFVTISNYGNLSKNNSWIGDKTKAFLTDTNIQFKKKLSMQGVDYLNIYKYIIIILIMKKF